jgi:hypothetical protein
MTKYHYRLNLQKGDRELHDISCLSFHYQAERPTTKELGEPDNDHPAGLGSKVFHTVSTELQEYNEIRDFLGDLAACGPCSFVVRALPTDPNETEYELRVDGAYIRNFLISDTLHLVWVASSNVP